MAVCSLLSCLAFGSRVQVQLSTQIHSSVAYVAAGGAQSRNDYFILKKEEEELVASRRWARLRDGTNEGELSLERGK